MPFYLHPRNPLKRDARIYDGHPWLMGPAWAFGQETAVHALRLMGSGLFDEYPRLAIVLGHMGEGLPFSMWRVDNCNAWVENRHNYPAKRKIADYFSENFYITTSGNFRTQALINAILEIGADRIMFSTDWPFENIDHAAVWFDGAAISENDRRKIGRTNAGEAVQAGTGLNAMQGKIGLEEHFAMPETALNPRGTYADVTWAELKGRLLELHGERLALMDEHGIEMMVVSLNAPAVQAVPDPNDGGRRWRGAANDALAERGRTSARTASRRWPRCRCRIRTPRSRSLSAASGELGFKGALVNGFSQVNDPDNAVYYDLPQYRPFWAAVERLDVPFYLHPRSPLPRDARLYAGHPWLMGAAWAFGNETAVHALRLMGSGLFDEIPRLAIVLGHMGEGLPFGLWRIDNCNLGAQKTDGKQGQEEDRRLFPRPIST